MSLFDCFDLCLNYGNSVAVEGFSYSFCSSDYICIVGENGSGKSTLLKGILGIKPLSKGKIVFNELKRNEIGFLPQKISSKIDFPASVFEVVLSGFCARVNFFNFYSNTQKNRAVEILDALGISQLKNKSFRYLSRGQQQCVLFARSVCAAVKILFLDEPCASLDPLITIRIYKMIEWLNVEKKITIVMVTHDLKPVLNCAKTIIHMNKKPIFIGSFEEYKKSLVGRSFLKGV